MRTKAAFWTLMILGLLLCGTAAWRILAYKQTDGVLTFLVQILLPFSLGFGAFVLAPQVRKRMSR